MQTRTLPPGPKGHWLYGSLPERKKDPIGIFMRARATYGDLVSFRMGPARVLLLSNPDHIKHVLVDNAQNYGKGPGIQRLKDTIGEGLLASEGDFWKRQRRLAQPAFHKEALAGLAGLMVDATRAMLERWASLAASGQPFDVMSEMMRLTLSIVGRALFTTDVSESAESVRDAITVVLHETDRRLFSFFRMPFFVPTARNRRYLAARDALDKVVLGIIEGRRGMKDAPADLLSMLMDARDEETGEGMTNQQLRDEVMTLFAAGHETTANALTWTWLLLGQNPEAERKLREELSATLGDRPPTAQDLPRLRYTSMVFEEAMRLYPPAWLFARRSRGPDEIGGYPVPPGRIVLVSPYVMHHHPAYWEDPERFEPERFSPERSAKRPRYAYFPFGGGQRMCIGNNFATMEAVLILATVMQRYRITVVEGQRIEPLPLITLRPKHGLQVTIAPAAAPATSATA